MEKDTPTDDGMLAVPWKGKHRKHREGGHGRLSIEDKGKIIENKKMFTNSYLSIWQGRLQETT
jgi:hypothetical protein